jgi:hypothetical protein
MKPTRQRVLLGLALLPLAAGLAACGGGAGSSADKTSNGSAAESAPAPARSDSLDGDFASGQDGATAARAASKDLITRAVIATGELRLTTSNLDDARQDAINLATGLHGFVSEEQSQSDSHGKLDRVDITLRVPAASFEKALDGLAALGTVRHRTQSVEDVSTQVIDIAARVRAQKASVNSIQQLLARANTIAEIISIEGQLATRQADLDSLEQQQRYLDDQTSLSTIQLTLTHPAKPTHKEHDKATGFLAGLDGGWHALGDSVMVVGTVLGALLPFAVVLALIGTPVWMVVRRRRVVASPAPAPEL